MKVAWLIVPLLAIFVFRASNAFPSGPPIFACQSMVPQHRAFASSPNLYSFGVIPNTFVAGGSAIQGIAETSFHLIQRLPTVAWLALW